MVVNLRTAVSLFAGVGGFDLALERAGVRVVASVEWDKNAQNVLANRFPNSKIFGDIQGVSGEQLRAAGFEPANGIITGGFPCQDLSVAGKRAGLAGKRSGLFWEICRLLDETRSQTVILENVPGLLSSNNGRDMAVVIQALVERGYRVGWRVLDAQHFGVAQRRRRVFIVGCLGESGRTPEEILALTEGRAGYLAKSSEKGKEAAGKIRKGSANGKWWDGSDTADTLTRTSSEQRMPDKNRLQAVVYPEQMGTITTAFGAKNYSNHQELLEGSVVVLDTSSSEIE
jgi:DNA (cytosine-5)-methyltransferase 1